MLLRRIARPLFATWFVSEGLDVLRRPTPHVTAARDAWDSLRARLPAAAVDQLPPSVLQRELSDAQLTALVRAHGGALLVAGSLLATGKLPRTSALVLAVLTAPLVVVNLPDKRVDGGNKELRRRRREKLVRALAFTGGALLAGADYEGRPGLGWRVQHARAEHARSSQE